MAIRQPHCNNQAFARRGDEISQRHPKVEAGSHEELWRSMLKLRLVRSRLALAFVRTQMHQSQ
jgi:hypothetical protein